MIVLNNDERSRDVTLESDLGLWLPTAERYHVMRYDGTGKRVDKTTWSAGPRWRGTTPVLDPLDLAFIEIVAAP